MHDGRGTSPRIRPFAPREARDDHRRQRQAARQAGRQLVASGIGRRGAAGTGSASLCADRFAAAAHQGHEGVVSERASHDEQLSGGRVGREMDDWQLVFARRVKKVDTKIRPIGNIPG